MSTALRFSACLLIAASLVACNETDPPAPAAPADEASARASAEAPRSEEAVEPVLTDESTVELTMDNAEAYVQALKNLGALGGGSVAMDAGESMEQYEARLASVPQVVAAIEDAGMSVGEFARFGEIFLAGVMAQAAIEAGQMQAPPEGLEAAVEFVEQNKAEIHALLASAEGG